MGSFDLQTVWPERFSDEGGNADSLCLVADADIDGDGDGIKESASIGIQFTAIPGEIVGRKVD